jgi:methyl-accepting chemotaxis protein
VSDIVAEIAAASREQSSGIEQVNRAVMQMDELTQQNAALVEQATASSQAMADQARELNEMMNRYRVQREGGEALASHTSPAEASAERVAAAAKKAVAERRSKARPWAGSGKRERPAAAAANGSAGAAMPATAASRKQASNSDSDWQEF